MPFARGYSPSKSGGRQRSGLGRRSSATKTKHIGPVTVESVLHDVCKVVYHHVEGDNQDLESGHHVDATTILPQLLGVWRALSSYLLQELSVGRSVNLAPLGVFFRPVAASPTSGDAAAFKASDRFVKETDVHCEDVGPAGPTSRAKLERVADILGWPRKNTEDVVHAILKEVYSKMGCFPEVHIDFPGLGKLEVQENRLSFLPAVARSRPSTPPRDVAEPPPLKAVTAAHTMFGATGTRLLRQTSSSATLKPLDLPKADRSVGLHRGDATPASASSSRSSGQRRCLQSKKSLSTPTLALHRVGKDGTKLDAERFPLPRSLKAGTDRHLFPAAATVAELESPKKLIRGLPSNDQLFPPLLDRCSRTRTALFREEVDCDLVSNVIASNLSRKAATLTIDPHAKDDSGPLVRWKRTRADKKDEPKANDGRALDVRAVDWTKEWPSILDDSPIAKETSEVGLELAEFCRVLSRYRYYTEGGISSDVLAPYNKQWLDHATFMLDLDNKAIWPALDTSRAQKVCEEVKKEILQAYISSSKTSVVNYALLNERCRERLDVAFTPQWTPQWGCTPFVVPDIGTFGGPPQAWRASLAAGRSSLLTVCVQNSKTALRLKEFWLRECADIRFLSCPAKHSDVRDINGFHALQVSQLEKAIRQLSEAWTTIVKVVSEEPMYLTGGATSSVRSGSGGHRSRRHLEGAGLSGALPEQVEARFFDAVAVLLSQMAREAVERTLQDYVDFFERFAAEPLPHEAVKQLKDTDTWQDEILVNKLIVDVKGDKPSIKFKQDLDQVSARLLLPYKECTTSLKEFQRPDARLRDILTGRTLLWEVREDEDHIKAGYQRIEQIVKANLANAEQVLQLYKPFVFLLDEEERVQAFTDDKTKERSDYTNYVNHLRETLEEMNQACPAVVRTQMMRVDAADVNRKLEKCAEACIEKLLRILGHRNQDRGTRLVKSFVHLDQRIMRVPNNEDQLVHLEGDVENAMTAELPKLLQEYEDIKEWISLTWDLNHRLQGEDYECIYSASKWKNYATNINDRESALKEDRAKIETKLTERRTKFEEELTTIVNKVSQFKGKGSIRMLEDYIEQINDIKKQLTSATATMEDINAKEVLIGWEAADFEALGEAQNMLDPFDRLWNLVYDHQKANTKWRETPLFTGEINPETVENDVNTMWDSASELKAQFEQDSHPKPANVASKVKQDLEAFKENVPLLHALCNPGLRDRHWQEISQVVGFQLDPDPSFTLKRMLDMDVGTFVTEIAEIAEGAGKEFQIESGLDEQYKEWAQLVMLFQEWATSGTFVFDNTSLDAACKLVESHVAKLEEMKGSEFAGEFQTRIQDWDAFLKKASTIADVLPKVQSLWQEVESAFAPDENIQELESESQQFREVDESWQKLVKGCMANPSTLLVFQQANFLQELTTIRGKLESLQKRLGSVLRPAAAPDHSDQQGVQ